MSVGSAYGDGSAARGGGLEWLHAGAVEGRRMQLGIWRIDILYVYKTGGKRRGGGGAKKAKLSLMGAQFFVLPCLKTSFKYRAGGFNEDFFSFKSWFDRL